MRLIFDRYTVREFLPPFLACVAGVTVMLISSILYELFDYVFDNLLPLRSMLELLAYKLPDVILIAVPIAVLFATLLSLGRLAKDSEITAMRSAGVAFKRMILPVLILGIVISGISFVLHEEVVPEANHRAQNLFRSAIMRDAMPRIEENVFFRGPDGHVFYVGRISTDHQLEQIMIMAFDSKEVGYPDTIHAERGRFENGIWYLEDGFTRFVDERGFTELEQRWERLEYPTPDIDPSLFGTQKTVSEMTRAELRELMSLYSRAGLQLHGLEIEYHLRLATPLACFLWILIGAPLALRSPRNGRFFGIVVAILIVFAYYVITALFRSLGGNGFLSPFVAAWATTAVFLIIGVGLLLRADRV